MSSEEEEQDPQQLFYAYAHRTDNHAHSRYLLTFSSASVCAEWWSLIQSAYPASDSGATRHGPQLFSFHGDDFPSKPAKSKQFEHLRGKWFYTQFGDATGTGGRGQDVLPLQGWDGGMVVGGGGGKGDDGKGDGDGGAGAGGLDISVALKESLEKTQEVMQGNNAQIARLAENQTKGQERIERMEKVMEGCAQQVATLAEENAKAQRVNRELVEENARMVRELQRQRREVGQEQQKKPSFSIRKGEVDGNGEEGKGVENCGHDVHPPPRKIDKQLVGYAYGKSAPKRS